MSSHRLDVAGARSLTTTTNDPAATVVWMPAKQGEDVEVTVSGGRELRLMLPENARIQRRRVTVKKAVMENGRPKIGADGQHVYDDVDEYLTVLVLAGGATMFLRCSSELFADDDPAKPTHENHPHTNVVARRRKDAHYLESGELVKEREFRDWNVEALLAPDRNLFDAPPPGGDVYP